MQTRQCTLQAQLELKTLVVKNLGADDQTKIKSATTLFQQSDSNSEERYLAEQALLALFQRTDLPVEQTIEAARNLYRSSPEGSEGWQLASRLLLQVAQRTDLSVKQSIEAAQNLYQYSPEEGSEGRQFARQLLLQVAQRTDLPVEQTLEAAQNLSPVQCRVVGGRAVCEAVVAASGATN